MTYSSDVLTDTPLHYFRLNETSGTTAANAGSSTLTTGTIAGTVTLGELAPGTIDGTSMKFDGSNAASVTTISNATTFTTHTIELWYKANPGFVFDMTRLLARMGTASVFIKVWLNLSNGLLRIEDNSNGFTTGKTVTALSDGNWHHIVITKSGTTVTYYVDGISRGTDTITTSAKTIQCQIGQATSSGDGPGGWIDEFAFYTTALTTDRIQTHYATALSTPKMVQSASFVTSAGSTVSTGTLPSAATAGNLLVFALAGDKNTGALTMTGTGWSKPIELTSASVSLYVAYKTAVGGETAITGTHPTGSLSGDTGWVAEYQQTGNGLWTVAGSASTITTEANVSSASTGTTGVTTRDGVALAFAAVDSGSSIVTKSNIVWSNSYVTKFVDPSTQGEASIIVAELPLAQGSTTSTTVSGLSAPDQISTALLVMGRAAPVASTSVRVQPPAQALSLTAPTPTKVGFVKNSLATATAMSVSLSTVAPASVKVTSTIVATAVQSRDSSASGATLQSLAVGRANATDVEGYFQFPDLIAGWPLSSVVKLRAGQAMPSVLTIHRITAPWDEATAGGTVAKAAAAATVTIPSGVANGSFLEFDITDIAKQWAAGAPNYGIAFVFVSGTSNNYTNFTTEESTTPANRPILTTSYGERPAEVVSVIAPAITATLTMPQHSSRTGRTIAAPVATATVTAIDAQVRAASNIKVTSPVITAGVVFLGGQDASPDKLVRPNIIDSWLSSPNANVALRYPVKTTVAGAMELTLNGTTGTSINLTTNKLSKTTPMTARITMVGLYFKDADRYLKAVGTTVDKYDVWYQMTELSGQIAVDATGVTNDWRQDGLYQGPAPVFNVDGPHLRRAVRFNGIDNWLRVGPYDKTRESLSIIPDTIVDAPNANGGYTIEFSIRTTQSDGVVFAGTGAQSGRTANLVNSATSSPFYSGNEVRLESGELVLVWGSDSNNLTKTKVRKFIADGEWHHVVISLIPNEGSVAPHESFVFVDGESILKRRLTEMGGPRLIPVSFMARPGKSAGRTGGNTSPFALDFNSMSGFLAGDLRDVIVRNENLSATTAQKLYYEWSDSQLVQPEPITVSLSAVAPVKARGNVQRMLCIFGLEESYTVNQNSSVLEIYYSSLSGLRLPSAVENFNASFNFLAGTGQFIERTPFSLDDFLVYPVSIEGAFPRVHTEYLGTPYDYARAGLGALGAGGVLNGEYVDESGFFIDDSTGVRRWLDVRKDLAEPLGNFDAITVMNYPWTMPDDPAYNVNAINTDGVFGPQARRQRSRGLTQFEWETNRNAFRDSLLEALYQGINFWITEHHMALHMGFVQAIDVHTTGRGRDLSGTLRPGAPLHNVAAFDLDTAHRNGLAVRHKGDFYLYPQANWFKRIVATEPGLTDMPSYEPGELISAWAYDDFDVTQDFLAWDVIEKPNGLHIGDKVRLNLVGQENAGGSPDLKRQQIISAKPQGIVGKVIAREMDTYAGEFGVVVQNPYKDNATTIVVERGTILKGRPIQGRVFIEFMDYGQFTRSLIPEDKIKNKVDGIAIPPNEWVGNGGTKGSTWSFDNRRYRKVLVSLIVQKMKFVDGELKLVNLDSQYSEFEDGDYIYRPIWPMMARGLNWLALADSLAPGAVKAYVPSMEIKVTMPNPGFSKTRNVVSTVNGAMRMDLEVRQPANYRDGQAREKALPMVLNLEMKGTGKVVKVPAATLSLSMLNTTITAGGDKITVYLEREDTIKVFLKEDN